MDLPGYSLYCDGKTCTMTHSGIWGMYTKEMGQYEVFMGHDVSEAFRRVNASLAIVKRHMAGEIRNHNHDNGIFWSFWPYPVEVMLDQHPFFLQTELLGLATPRIERIRVSFGQSQA